MSKPQRYSAEVRERAVRMVREHEDEHRSEWAAISSIAEKIGCSAETLRKWVRQDERVQLHRQPRHRGLAVQLQLVNASNVRWELVDGALADVGVAEDLPWHGMNVDGGSATCATFIRRLGQSIGAATMRTTSDGSRRSTVSCGRHGNGPWRKFY